MTPKHLSRYGTILMVGLIALLVGRYAQTITKARFTVSQKDQSSEIYKGNLSPFLTAQTSEAA
jgi:hypothetical protein